MKHFCGNISRLLSDGYERELTLPERMRIRMHLWMCRPCSNYGNSLGLINRLLADMRRHADEHAPCLSDRDRQKILTAVRETAVRETSGQGG